jgi:hypothetical protein
MGKTSVHVVMHAPNTVARSETTSKKSSCRRIS